MPQSLVQIYVHIVFSTKERRPVLERNTMCQWMNDTFGIEPVVDAPAGRVKPLQGLPYRGTKTQGALRDPGLWCRTALPFTLSPNLVREMPKL
jgi:hypothetical protein